MDESNCALIATPPSTKNPREPKRDETMGSARKGNNYSSDMNTYIGVEADSSVMYTVEVATA